MGYAAVIVTPTSKASATCVGEFAADERAHRRGVHQECVKSGDLNQLPPVWGTAASTATLTLVKTHGCNSLAAVGVESSTHSPSNLLFPLAWASLRITGPFIVTDGGMESVADLSTSSEQKVH